MPAVVRPPLSRLIGLIARSVTIALACPCFLQPGFVSPVAKAQTQPKAQTQFDLHLTEAANSYLDRRGSAMKKVQTRADAEARRKRFREFVLEAIGGLPKERMALNAKVVGTLDADGFKVERLIYDSLPGFHIPADLYLPESGQPPFPAVLYTPGHYPNGKLEAWNLASNMARNGIAVLAYDPIGEGERLQYFDPETKKSRAGQPTGEHSEAAVQIALTGDYISRYFIWDAMRGLDYLASRPDIDATRLGALGCSGGGTVTAYLSALDSRVKAAGVACYITSFSKLLGTIGPQEAEQSIPGFIAHGFDFPDWIEAAAPVPYAVISTTEDMFPFEGARNSVEEAKRIYGLYGATDNLRWITGPGQHGNLRPIYPEIIGFFLKQLARSDKAPKLVQLEAPAASRLECTSTGQVSTALGGETLYSINRATAQSLQPKRPTIRNSSDFRSFRNQVMRTVRTTTGLAAQAGANTLQVSIGGSSQRNGYVLKSVKFASETGEELGGVLALPSQPGKKAAVLLLEEGSDDPARQGGELDRFARAGNVVFAPQLPPATPDGEAPKSQFLGPFYLASLRAQLVGKTLVGLRTDDAIRCAEWLSSEPDVDAAKISAWGSGAMGIVLLHAATLDPGIREVTVDKTLISYRAAVEAPMTRNFAQSVVPGVLRNYDLEDLIVAIAPRAVSIHSPIDGEGNPVTRNSVEQALSWVSQTDRTLHHPERVKMTFSAEEAVTQVR